MRGYLFSFRRVSLSILEILSFSFLTVQSGHAQGIPSVVVEASTDSQQIRIGEQFQLTIRAISSGTSNEIAWPSVTDTFDHLLVVKQSPVDTIKDKKQTVFQQQLTVTGFDSGTWTIPSFAFHVFSAGKDSSNRQTLLTDSILISVNTVAVDTTKPIQPIKAIRKAPFNLLDYWPYWLGGLLLLLVLLYFKFFYKKKEKTAATVPLVPPYEEAMQNLEQLKQKELWRKGEVKEHYSLLTDIIRRYIHRQYHINALEQTSEELLTKIKQVTRLNQKREELRSILETADLVKFAKLSPQEEEHQQRLEQTRLFIEWAKPREPKKDKEKEETSKEQDKQ